MLFRVEIFHLSVVKEQQLTFENFDFKLSNLQQLRTERQREASNINYIDKHANRKLTNLISLFNLF